MDGFICINKPKGKSSGFVVAQLKRLFGSKCGHCGTLDPMATGVLPIALGKATRLSEYVMGGEKTYLGEVRFGIETVTYDADGEVTSEQDASFVTAEMIEQLLPQFTGNIMQAPPPVSALKRGGEPLYKKVRRGEQVQVEERPATIYSLRLTSFSPATAADPHPRCTLEICCAQGVYIRSLAYDLGKLLGCGAHLSSLVRTQVGQFLLQNSYTLEEVIDLVNMLEMGFMLEMNQVVAHIPSLTATQDMLALLVHGNDCVHQGDDAPLLRVLDENNRLLGIGSRSGNLLSMHKVLVNADEYLLGLRPLRACAIGNFDGLHMGHHALMQELYSKKRALSGAGAVVTFSPHPLLVIRGQAPELLCSEALKNEILYEFLSVDRVITLEFTRQLMHITQDEFVDNFIVPLGVKEVVVGYNFTYAAQGRGTAKTLQQQCARRGINVTIISEVSCEYGPVSSTRIRQLLQQGDLEAANTMLGYWFTMEGEVVYGNQIGRSIGFPTANFFPEEGLVIPVHGVYAGRIEHRGQTYDGVINFGIKPTIGGESKPLVEACIFDHTIDLYGDNIRVRLGKFIRPERRFSSLDDLKAEIAKNEQAARQFLATQPQNAHLPKPVI